MEDRTSVLTRVTSFSLPKGKQCSVTQTSSDLSREKVQKFYLHQAAGLKVKEIRRNYEWFKLRRGTKLLSGLKNLNRSHRKRKKNKASLTSSLILLLFTT